MRFTFTPEQEAFRGEVNDFLKEALPPTGRAPTTRSTTRAYEFGRAFLKKLAPKRWIAPAWPKRVRRARA